MEQNSLIFPLSQNEIPWFSQKVSEFPDFLWFENGLSKITLILSITISKQSLFECEFFFLKTENKGQIHTWVLQQKSSYNKGLNIQNIFHAYCSIIALLLAGSFTYVNFANAIEDTCGPSRRKKCLCTI